MSGKNDKGYDDTTTKEQGHAGDTGDSGGSDHGKDRNSPASGGPQPGGRGSK